MAVFLGCRAKIDRVKEQFEELKSEMRRFPYRDAYRITQEPDFESMQKLAIFHPTMDLPIKWSIILGDIFHNLRSSLDHSITELTIAESGSQLNGTEFPIFDNEASFFQTRRNSSEPTRSSGLYKIRGVNDHARKAIESLQPFRVRQAGSDPFISLFHELSIIDKHRTPILCRLQNRSLRLEIIRDILGIHRIKMLAMPGTILEDGTILASWCVRETPDTEMDMNIDLAFDIALYDIPKLRKIPIGKVCESIIGSVEKVIFFLESIA